MSSGDCQSRTQSPTLQTVGGTDQRLSPTAVQRVGVAISTSESTTKRIGPYRLGHVIGQGGMGVVYLAEQEHPIRRTVALKLIKPGMDSREIIARFESERQALAMMNHRNVAKVLDAGTSDEGRPYFVMEYVPGEPITAYCDRHQYTIKQRLKLFEQACDAVQHAHQKAIIHRDLKPSNILVTVNDGAQHRGFDDAEVKVIDFGVAKALSAKAEQHTLFTQAGQLIGTPEYMSPEQAGSDGHDVDTRSDIYSLGVVLYELLTGALPFDPKTLRSSGIAAIQRIIREVDPPRPSTRLSSLGESAIEIARSRQTQLAALRRELRSELEWIPLKAMRKEPEHRYATAVNLAQDIENYLEHQPLLAGPESRAYQLRKFVRRNASAVLTASAAVLILLMLISGLAVSNRLIAAERNAKAAAVKQMETALQDAEAERLLRRRTSWHRCSGCH